MQTGEFHIVLTTGAVDDEGIVALVCTDEYAHMTVAGIEYQIPGKGLAPRDGHAVGVLCMSAAAVPDDKANTEWLPVPMTLLSSGFIFLLV